jgi:hypothetical protein
MSVTDRVEGFGEVWQQMNAIGDLDRVGGAVPGPGRIGSGPIPRDHADAGMGLSPKGKGRGLTIGQKGERSPLFEVDQHGPIALAFPHGPIINAEHLGCGPGRKGETTQQAPQGVATDGQAQRTAQPRSRHAAQCHSDVR